VADTLHTGVGNKISQYRGQSMDEELGPLSDPSGWHPIWQPDTHRFSVGFPSKHC